jgi:hypothetical protein
METIQFEYLNLIAAYMLHALVESQSMGKLLYAFKNVRNMEKFIWQFAPKRDPKIFSLILRYPKISLNSNKSKDKFYGYERISLTG